jgi:hypothetical protein
VRHGHNIRNYKRTLENIKNLGKNTMYEKLIYDIEHFFDNKSEKEVQDFFNEIEKENEFNSPIVEFNSSGLVYKNEKLIFLDIDGVLNSELFYKIRSEDELYKIEGYPLCEIDPSAIEKVNKIIRKTGAKVIISSSWRIGRSIEYFQELFNKKGFIGTISGLTPHLSFKQNTETVPRGCEIEVYLSANYSYNEKAKIKYVIIDDDADMMLYQKNNFLLTNEYDGITEAHVFDAINFLNN